MWPCGRGYQEAVSERDDIEPSGLGVPRDKFKNEIFWVLQASPHKTVHSEVCPSPRWSLLGTTSQPIQVSKGNSHSVLRLLAVQSTTPWTVLMVRPGIIYGDQNTLQTNQRSDNAYGKTSKNTHWPHSQLQRFLHPSWRYGPLGNLLEAPGMNCYRGSRVPGHSELHDLSEPGMAGRQPGEVLQGSSLRLRSEVWEARTELAANSLHNYWCL